MRKFTFFVLAVVIMISLAMFGTAIYKAFFNYKGKVQEEVCTYMDEILEETDNSVRNYILSGTSYEVEVIDREQCSITITSMDMELCLQEINTELSKQEITEDEEENNRLVEEIFENIIKNFDQKRTYEIVLNYSYEDSNLILNTTSEFYDALFGGSFSTFEGMLENNEVN